MGFVSPLATGPIGFSTSTLSGAWPLPFESVATYETGVAVPAKFASGENNTSPVFAAMFQAPSPATLTGPAEQLDSEAAAVDNAGDTRQKRKSVPKLAVVGLSETGVLDAVVVLPQAGTGPLALPDWDAVCRLASKKNYWLGAELEEKKLMDLWR
jgi:hypothetical protein